MRISDMMDEQTKLTQLQDRAKKLRWLIVVRIHSTVYSLIACKVAETQVVYRTVFSLIEDMLVSIWTTRPGCGSGLSCTHCEVA